MISVKNLAFAYGRERAILNDIDFCSPKGCCTAVLGNNGAGKSTLIKCLNRILEPKQGVVYADGKNVRELHRDDIAKNIAYVAQRSAAQRVTVFDAVLLGRKPYIKFDASKEDTQIVGSAISRLGLEELSMRYTDELSGGELQKVMLARALAQQPRILLLDEPTGNLDLGNQYKVLETIKQITRTEQISTLIVIHDLNLALRYCDRFLLLKDGRIFSYGGIEVMTSETIRAVYGLPVAVQEINGVTVVIPYP